MGGNSHPLYFPQSEMQDLIHFTTENILQTNLTASLNLSLLLPKVYFEMFSRREAKYI